MRLNYFAYGSNMLSPRLKARCRSAHAIGTATLRHFETSFCKKGRDGSGKMALRRARGAQTRGVLFSLLAEEAMILDAVEGDGYDRLDGCLVRDDNGLEYTAFSYIALAPKPDLLPHDWYLALIIAGATEHDLTGVAHLYEHVWSEDRILDRSARLEALKALDVSGHKDWHALLNSQMPVARPTVA